METPNSPPGGKVGGNRNYGYGKTLVWAGKNALLDKYAYGHYATVAAHVDHWRLFCHFAKTQGIKDARQIHPGIVQRYAQTVAEQVHAGTIKVAYGQNLLSSVNRVLQCLRGDNDLALRPAAYVGLRQLARQAAPRYLDRETLHPLQTALGARGEERLAAQIGLARELMLRFKETCLMDTRQALRQAERTGVVTVTEGTKGGRGKSHHPGVERRVPVTSEAITALRIAAQIQGDATNLIPSGLRYDTWRDHCYRIARAVGMTGFHDLRAAGACERYQALTGSPAPVRAGNHPTASAARDRAAREQLMPMLGHSSFRPMDSYLGKWHG